MTSASFFFWYILPVLISVFGWGVAAYVTRNDSKPPHNQHPAE
ncbi:hypothetical protein ACQKKX_09070 [Neorhizobium sp. NPDC001467]